MTETNHLKYLLIEIGHSVHNLNTIAVALSNLPKNTLVSPGLNIKWEPKDPAVSSIAARRFAVRSSIVFAAENLFEYLSKLSNDPMWKALKNGRDFNKELASQDSKARRFSEFCKKIPDLEREWVLLVELLCHWRNRIVHASTSKSQLSSTNRKYLESKSTEIFENFHHFEISKALADYRADKVTLKEATTLITFLIKCCRAIDKYYFASLKNIGDVEIHEALDSDDAFRKIRKQQASKKRSRQVDRYIRVNYGYFSTEQLSRIVTKYS